MYKYKIERFVWMITGFIFFIMASYRILNREYIFTHDTLHWYGIFHFFTESLYQGIFPLWNPYLHSGEMFFPYLGMLNLIDPINLIGIGIGKLIGFKDLFYLYEIIFFFKIIFIVYGVQLVLELLVPRIKNYSVFIFFILLLSTFTFNVYHQHGALFVFGYFPFILYFFLKFQRKNSWTNILLLGYFSGVSFQSMHFAYLSTFIFIFVGIFFFHKRIYLKTILHNKIKFICALFVFIVLTLPSSSLFFYKDSLFPYARNLFNPLADEKPPLFFHYSEFENTIAAFGKVYDFISLGLYSMAKYLYIPLQGELIQKDITIVKVMLLLVILVLFFIKRKSHIIIQLILLLALFLFPLWLDSKEFVFSISEMNMYIGFIPFVLGLIGLFYVRDRYKLVFGITLFVAAALFIGPIKYNYVYQGIFTIFPPLRLLENAHEFANFFLFCYFYFVGLGLVFVVTRIKNRTALYFLFFLTLLELYSYSKLFFNNTDRMFSLIKRETISNYTYKLFFQIDSEVFEQNLLNSVSNQEKDILVKLYKKNKNIYILKDEISELERNEWRQIVEQFLIPPMDFIEKSKEFRLMTREKSIFPKFMGSNYLLEGYEYKKGLQKKFDLKSVEDWQYLNNYLLYVQSEDPKKKLNFISLINRIPTATDTVEDLSYQYIKILSPNALTYPVLYANILKSKVSDELKSILFGVGLPPVEFYTSYRTISDEKLLNPQDEREVINILQSQVVISDDQSFSKFNTNNQDSQYKPNIEILEYNPNYLKLSVETSMKGVLLFRDGFDSNWKVKVDNVNRNLFRANYNSKAVFLDSKKSIVEFRYCPTEFIVSLYLYFFSTIAIISFIGYDFVSKKLKR